MIGYIGFTVEKNIFISFGDFYFEMGAPKILTDIKGIAMWTKQGYFILDTNYGEEYYELYEYLNELYTREELDSMGVYRELERVSYFKIVRVCMTKTEIRDMAGIIVDNIALVKKEGGKIVVAVDLNNIQSKMVFKNVAGSFVLVSSSYPDGKRKYQALYIMKCNESLILGV